jgi:hypothetical protein
LACSSPNTIRVIKSRRMRRFGHVVGLEEKIIAYEILDVSSKI